ncbi:nucleoid-associated protein [Hymenobacter jeollabukensis]|uniref:Nucleoid-associated protein n=1 Tax=Hymenobacter jeollabukensis TaxID=2025313 RepID=A0A5R8WNA3_9BACT|nr:nucleoid-associated protein [Hymenobacter jeollabukensis]TLM91050.1 hypothetical protein FDY95_15745 [Hymenobacter jeollabukensis]
MLTIKHIIVHHLHKEQHKSNTQLDLSNSLLTIDESSQRLVEELNNRYGTHNNSKVTYAKFGTGTVFPSAYHEFHANQNAEAFIKFTKETIVDLEKTISGVRLAKGGYVVFTQFENNQDFTGIYIIREKKGVLFKKDKDGSFKINDTFHIDFEKIAMGCRINNSVYNNSSNRYLSFIDSRKDEVSKFFNDWISTDNNTDNVTDTKALHRVLNKIDLPLDEHGNIAISREDLLNKAFHIIKDQSRTVDIAQLSHVLYNDPDHIARYVIDNNIEMSGMFKADSATLRKFSTIKVAADNIMLSFPLKALNELVTISEAHPDMITIRSEALANKIRNESLSSQQS